MKEYLNHKYLIDGTTVKVWLSSDPEDKEPFLLQPFNPSTGAPFLSEEDAEQWVIEYINQSI